MQCIIKEKQTDTKYGSLLFGIPKSVMKCELRNLKTTKCRLQKSRQITHRAKDYS